MTPSPESNSKGDWSPCANDEFRSFPAALPTLAGCALTNRWLSPLRYNASGGGGLGGNRRRIR